MKILIADDEIYVRIGIKTTLDWNAYGFEIVGEAENGLEARDLFIKYKPDIILVDIFMPVMDGLQFIKEVKEINPFCRFIILSCHNEFEYVREAMKLGVRDYMIKTTVKREELLEIVTRVSLEIEADRKRFNELESVRSDPLFNHSTLIRNFFNDILDRVLTDKAETARQAAALQLDEPGKKYIVALFTIDPDARPRLLSDSGDYTLRIKGVAGIAQELLKLSGSSQAFMRNDREVVGIISMDEKIPDAECITGIASAANDILKSAKDFFNICLSAGIGSCVPALSQLGTSYFQACRAADKKSFSGDFNVNIYADDGSMNLNIVMKVKDYVRGNVQKSISLHDAAEYVNLSAGYLSRIFKKLTGENFIDYALGVKIEAAKGMIRRVDKILSVAHSLGYTELSSFSRIFKKIVGISPQAYKLEDHE